MKNLDALRVVLVSIAAVGVVASTAAGSGPAATGGKNPRRMFVTSNSASGPAPGKTYAVFPAEQLFEVPQGEVLVLDHLWTTWTPDPVNGPYPSCSGELPKVTLLVDGKPVARVPGAPPTGLAFTPGNKLSVQAIAMTAGKCSFYIFLTGHMMRN